MSYPETIAGCCRELLDASSEPLPIAQLAEHAVAVGRTRARYPELSVASAIQRDRHVVALPGGRYASLRRVLEGRVLTTTVPADALVRGCRAFDLTLFERLPEADEPELPEQEGLLLAHRYLDGQVVAELIPRDALGDGAPLVEAVQAQPVRPYLFGLDLRDRLLQVCALDDALLRSPVAPLSELFPELAPQPPVPSQRRCSACDGTGSVPDWRAWEPEWSPDPEPGWPAGFDDPPYAWRNRLERLEEVVFGVQ